MKRLAEGVVLGDGGYVLELEKRGYVIAGPFTPEVVLDHPEAVKQMHREFIRSGSEVIQAFAFYASREKLANVGYGEKVLDLNRQAVKIAREVAEDDVLVAGNLSTTWSYKQGDADSREIARRQFEEQLRVQVDEGVDFIIGELFFDLEEALIALDVAKATGLPVMMTMAYFKDKYSREGKDPTECAIALSQNGSDIVGINCGRGPNQMLPLVKEMRDAIDGYVAIQATAYATTDEVPFCGGLPGFPDGMEPFQVDRFVMADYAQRAKDMGVNYIRRVLRLGCGAHQGNGPGLGQARPREKSLDRRLRQPHVRHRGVEGLQARVGGPALRHHQHQLPKHVPTLHRTVRLSCVFQWGKSGSRCP